MTFNAISGFQDVLAELASAAVTAKPRWMWSGTLLKVGQWRMSVGLCK